MTPTTPSQAATLADKIADIVESQLRALDLGCGDEVNIADAIAHFRDEETLAGANELIGDFAAWCADDLIKSGLILTAPGTAVAGPWLPIDSAPLDGTPFLAWQGGERGPFKCWWHSDWAHNEAYWMDHSDSEPEPTHWKPLDAPPAPPAEG